MPPYFDYKKFNTITQYKPAREILSVLDISVINIYIFPMKNYSSLLKTNLFAWCFRSLRTKSVTKV